MPGVHIGSAVMPMAPGVGLAAAMDDGLAGRTGNTPSAGQAGLTAKLSSQSGHSMDLAHSMGVLPLGGPQASPGLGSTGA